MSTNTLPRRIRTRAEEHPGHIAMREKQYGLWEEVTWADPDTPPDLFGADPAPPPGDHPVTATQEFLQLARQVASHSDPERWSLLYAALMLFKAAALRHRG